MCRLAGLGGTAKEDKSGISLLRELKSLWKKCACRGRIEEQKNGGSRACFLKRRTDDE